LVSLVVIASHAAGFTALPNKGTVTATRRRLLLKASGAASDDVSIVAQSSASKAKGGEATVTTSTFNLAKSIIGAGVLSLPSGVAFFSDSPLALLPATAILTVMGLLSAYTFSIIGKACEKHNSTTFKDVWSKSVGPNSAWAISGAITAKCFFASLAYSIIIGDTFSALARTFALPAFFQVRRNVILLMTALVLFPLNSLKSLAALAPFSLLGLGGTLYTAIVMAVRYFDKSYAAGGVFHTALKASPAAALPSFHVKAGGGGLNMKAFVLLSMLSTAFISHYSAPVFHRELKDNTMPRFNKVTTLAYGASIAVFTFMMSIGFLTFGGSSAGFVLNNYASNDALITVARLAIGLSILTGTCLPPRATTVSCRHFCTHNHLVCVSGRVGYPFTFSALREGLLDLAKVGEPEKRAGWQRPLTVGMLGVVTVLAILLRDVGFVVSVSGAGFGSALMFVVPSLMNINNIKADAQGKELTPRRKLEVAANRVIIGLGVALGALGVTISTLKQLKKL
jgi:sodium-coupled neutral amino acid transporter 11